MGRVRGILLGVVVCVVAACAPTDSAIQAAATELMAATQTAVEPSPTPTLTPTVTSSPTLTPSPTATPLPSPTPDVRLALPAGFEVTTRPTFVTQTAAAAGDNLRVENLQAFTNADEVLVFTFSGRIPEESIETMDFNIESRLFTETFITFFAARSEREDLGASYGDISHASRDHYRTTGRISFTLDSVAFRNGAVFAYVGIDYRRGTNPGVDVLELADSLAEIIED